VSPEEYMLSPVSNMTGFYLPEQKKENYIFPVFLNQGIACPIKRD
jgi:hypothetical protein